MAEFITKREWVVPPEDYTEVIGAWYRVKLRDEKWREFDVRKEHVREVW